MTTASPQQPAGGVSSAEILGLLRESRSRPEGHKAHTGCTGKRNRAAYVSLDEYSERHLASDFGLLEEAQRAHEAAGRDRPARPKPFAELPSHIKTLIGQARSRGVHLEIQQPGMARRTRNSTRWEGGAKRHIVWRVDWRFPAAGDASVEDRRVPDAQPLRPCLEAHLAPAAGGGLAAGHVLRRYAQAGAHGLVVLMRRPHTPANALEYWRIDIEQPLRSQLQGRAVIEFPTLLVLTQEEFAAGNYPLARAPVPPPAPPPGPPPAAAVAASSAAAATGNDANAAAASDAAAASGAAAAASAAAGGTAASGASACAAPMASTGPPADEADEPPGAEASACQPNSPSGTAAVKHPGAIAPSLVDVGPADAQQLVTPLVPPPSGGMAAAAALDEPTR